MSRVKKMKPMMSLLALLCLLVLVTGCGRKVVKSDASSENYAQSADGVKTYGKMPSHASIMKDGLGDHENMQMGESTIQANSPDILGSDLDGSQGMAIHTIPGRVTSDTRLSSSPSGDQRFGGSLTDDLLGRDSMNSDSPGLSGSLNRPNQEDQLQGSLHPENTPLQKGVTFSRGLRDVHFEFDSWRLSDKARETLEVNAEWLRAHPHEHVTIEGHCDERGTQSYNYVLGEKRAAMVQQYLSFLGVPLEQLYVASYGKDRPACRTMTTDCFEQNRRAHFNSSVNIVSQQPSSIAR